VAGPVETTPTSSPVGSRSGFPRNLALAAAVAGGAMVGFQGRINGELAARMHSALGAALASFIIGLLVLVFVAPARRAGFVRLRRARTTPWWWLGGLGGALLVASSAHAVPRLGVALVSVCLVAGTTLGALVTDAFGLGPSGRHHATGWRLAGTVVAIGAVGISGIGEPHKALQPWLLVLLLFAGATAAVQQAANGQLRASADDVVVATVVSFVGGTLALVVVAGAAGDLSSMSWPATGWLYLGGPLGVVYIHIGAATVRVLGVLRFALGAVAGQLISSVVIDATWPQPGTALHAGTVVGAVVTVVGVWLSGLQGRPTRSEGE
jgi:transporter family-2 protein